MPYVKRDSAQQIIALLKTPEPGADELLPLSSPEIAAFLGAAPANQAFDSLLRLRGDRAPVRYSAGALDRAANAQRRFASFKMNARRFSSVIFSVHCDFTVSS